MKTFWKTTISFFLLLALAPCSSFAAATTNISYYFPEGDTCTLILDLQPEKKMIEQASGVSRLLLLAKKLVTEFKLHGDSKCGNSKKIRMMAVYIPGVDNYGRPNFGGRINLLRIDGTAVNIKDLDDSTLKSIEALGNIVSIVPVDK